MPTRPSSSIGAFAGLFRVHADVDAERLGDLQSDGQDRIERGHRLLEDHRDVAAADLAHLLVGEVEQIAAFEHHPRPSGCVRSASAAAA